MEELKRLLKANRQMVSGNKPDLIHRVATGAALGTMPKCTRFVACLPASAACPCLPACLPGLPIAVALQLGCPRRNGVLGRCTNDAWLRYDASKKMYYCPGGYLGTCGFSTPTVHRHPWVWK